MPQEKPKKKKKKSVYVGKTRRRIERASELASDNRRKAGVGYDSPFSASNLNTLFFPGKYRETLRKRSLEKAQNQAHKEQSETMISRRKQP